MSRGNLLKTRGCTVIAAGSYRRDLDYEMIGGLRRETRQKLSALRPISLGHAAQVSGITPADISIISIWLRKKKQPSQPPVSRAAKQNSVWSLLLACCACRLSFRFFPGGIFCRDASLASTSAKRQRKHRRDQCLSRSREKMGLPGLLRSTPSKDSPRSGLRSSWLNLWPRRETVR